MSEAFRCSAASGSAEEPVAGSASTVRAFLLVEAPGPWGVDAVRDSRLPAEVKAWLGRLSAEHRVRPLLVRAHGRQRTSGTRVFAASVRGRRPLLESGVLDDPRELLDLDLGGLVDGRSTGLPVYDDLLFCVCTHGRHDACCAELGRPLCRAMHEVEPEATWEVSHIGGDRFAPNVLVLPWGLYYGRVRPEDAPTFARLHRGGELSLDHLRGRSSFGFALQAAEVAVRREAGARGIEPLPLLAHERDGQTTQAEFLVDGERWRVDVVSRPGAARQLTCRATADASPLTHRVTALTVEPSVVQR